MSDNKKILIDASCIVNKPTGAGRYAYNILKNIIELDKNNIYSVIVPKKLDKKNSVFGLKVNFIELDIPVIGIKRDIKLSIFLFKNWKKFDVFYCMMPYLPLFFKHPFSVITIHDLKFFRFKNFMKPFIKFLYFKIIYNSSVKKAKLIFSISKSTQKEIYNFFNISNKVRVVYGSQTIKDNKEILNSNLDISKKAPFFLCVAERRVHKNLEGLIKSFNLFLKKGGVGFLFLAGRDFQNNTDKLKKLSNSLGLSDKIIFIDNATDEDLIFLYKNALSFILVSFCEGFGLPLVEAMHFGVPVITSNVYSMSEIVGSAGILVNPYDIEEISNKMINVFKSEELRKSMIKKGIERSKIFSWNRSAKEILNHLNKLYFKDKQL